jgi:fatty acid desaturase
VRTHPRFDTVRAAFWALAAAVVLRFVFFAALGGIDPGDATVISIVVAVLGVLWIVHFLRIRATTDESRLSRSDRERRGF